MAIEIGKDVVCIKDASSGNYKRGETSNVEDIIKGCNHYPILLKLTKYKHFHDSTSCEICNKNVIFGYYAVNAKKFRALDDITPSIEEIVEQFKEELV